MYRTNSPCRKSAALPTYIKWKSQTREVRPSADPARPYETINNDPVDSWVDAAAVRLRDQGNDSAVVILSGWVDDEISANPPDCVHAVLKKPIDVESFMATIDEVLSQTNT